MTELRLPLHVLDHLYKHWNGRNLKARQRYESGFTRDGRFDPFIAATERRHQK